MKPIKKEIDTLMESDLVFCEGCGFHATVKDDKISLNRNGCPYCDSGMLMWFTPTFSNIPLKGDDNEC